MDFGRGCSNCLFINVVGIFLVGICEGTENNAFSGTGFSGALADKQAFVVSVNIACCCTIVSCRVDINLCRSSTVFCGASGAGDVVTTALTRVSGESWLGCCRVNGLLSAADAHNSKSVQYSRNVW